MSEKRKAVDKSEDSNIMPPAPTIYARVISIDVKGIGEQGAYLRRRVVGLISPLSVKFPSGSYNRPSVLGHVKLT